MNNNEMPIITVNDLIEFLKTFPGHLCVLKSDMLQSGYNRFQAAPQMMYKVQANIDPALDVAFVDAGDVGLAAYGEVMNAVVL